MRFFSHVQRHCAGRINLDAASPRGGRSIGADAHARDRDVEVMFDGAHVCEGALGQCLQPRAVSGGGACEVEPCVKVHGFEALELQGHGSAPFKGLCGGGEVGHGGTIQFVGHDDAQSLQPPEDVELGQRQLIEAVGAVRMAEHDEVQPTAPARATGRGAEFMPDPAEVLTDLILELRREGPMAGASCRP